MVAPLNKPMMIDELGNLTSDGARNNVLHEIAEAGRRASENRHGDLADCTECNSTKMAVLEIDPYAELVKALTGEDLRSLPDEVEALCSGGLGDSFVVDDQYEDDVLEWASAHSIICEHDGKDWRYTGEPEVVCRACFVPACRSWLVDYLSEHIEPDCADGSVSEGEIQRVASIVIALGTGVISREVLLLDTDGRSRALVVLGFGTGWMSGDANEALFDNEETARLFSALAWFDTALRRDPDPVEDVPLWYVTAVTESDDDDYHFTSSLDYDRFYEGFRKVYWA